MTCDDLEKVGQKVLGICPKKGGGGGASCSDSTEGERQKDLSWENLLDGVPR